MSVASRWKVRAGRKLGAAGRRVGVLPSRPAVLMYHRVSDEDVDPWGLAVSATRFEEQLRWLKHHRTVLPLSEFARRQLRRELPANAAAITFDDGYACNANVAAPLLAEHGLPATIFITTRPVATAEEFWWDDLQRIVLAADRESLQLRIADREVSVRLGDLRQGLEAWRSGTDPANSRQHAYLTLWRELRSLDAQGQQEALHDLRAQAGVSTEPRPSHRPMTAVELRRLAESGSVDIGSHTETHPALSEWPEEVQRAEIERGRSACAALTGRTPTTFAYPYGDYAPLTVELVRAAGFEVACTTRSAAVVPGSDPLQLPRLQVGNWSSDEMARSLRTI